MSQIRRRGGDNAATATATAVDEPKTLNGRSGSPRSKKTRQHIKERPLWQTILVYVFFLSITVFYGRIVASIVYEMPASDMAEPDTPLSYPEFSEKKAHAHLTHLAHTIGRRLTSTKNLEIDSVNYITSQLEHFKDHACLVTIQLFICNFMHLIICLRIKTKVPVRILRSMCKKLLAPSRCSLC